MRCDAEPRCAPPHHFCSRWAAVCTTVLLLTAGSAWPLTAQERPDSDGVAALEVVEALFDGMRARDVDAMGALFREEARLVTAGEGRDGTPRLGIEPISGWLEGVRGADAYLDEQIWDPVVEVSDRLATVWVKYALYVNEDFVHCGVDAFTLFRGIEGWRILQIVDTRRRENCWYPPR